MTLTHPAAAFAADGGARGHERGAAARGRVARADQVAERDGAIMEAARRLERRRRRRDDVAVRRPTLDDVFLALTGRVAEDDEEPLEPELVEVAA